MQRLCQDWEIENLAFSFASYVSNERILLLNTVKHLLIQLSQNEQLSGEVEYGNLNPVVFMITTQMPLKFFVHYCFKWAMKVFYELLSQYVWYQK